jgi:hypothetical protein
MHPNGTLFGQQLHRKRPVNRWRPPEVPGPLGGGEPRPPPRVRWPAWIFFSAGTERSTTVESWRELSPAYVLRIGRGEYIVFIFFLAIKHIDTSRQRLR